VKTPSLLRISTIAGERGAVDAERDVSGFAINFYTDEGDLDLVGNNNLAATQLGITISSLALGWIGEPALAHLVEPLLSSLPESLAVAIALGFEFFDPLPGLLRQCGPLGGVAG
jgi:hypothetical protein